MGGGGGVGSLSYNTLLRQGEEGGGGEISVIGKFKIPRGDNPPNVYK